MSDLEDEYEYEDDEEEYQYEDEDEGDFIESSDREETKGGSSDMKVSSTPSSSDAKASSPGSETRVVDCIPREGHYEVVSVEGLMPIFDRGVDEVVNLFDVDVDQAQILLQNFKWYKEALLNSYFEDSEKILKECGLTGYTPNTIVDCKPEKWLHKDEGDIDIPAELNSNQYQCRICCDVCDNADGFALGCDHKFCYQCYGGYLSSAVESGPACILTTCPQHQCPNIVTRSIFRLLCEKEVFDKYESYVVRNYIETSKNMRYCTAARCDKVIIGNGVRNVRCKCGNFMCFKCGEEAHDPCSCSQLSEWTDKCNSESETANWILANTKKCPKCSARIEKNQGCNHIACKMCKYEFCWICMGSWAEHSSTTGGFYKCNRFDVETPKEDASEAQKAKAELDRYLHYYQRFHAHNTSLKYASQDRANAEAKMVEALENKDNTYIDVQYQLQAVEQVIDCRRVLKYTYVLGFFLVGTSEEEKQERQLFEHHQEMLEKHTEKLHGFTEQNEQNEQNAERSDVVNLTRVTDKFLSSMVETISGGFVNSRDSI